MLCLEDWYNLWRPLANSFSREKKVNRVDFLEQELKYKYLPIFTHNKCLPVFPDGHLFTQ